MEALERTGLSRLVVAGGVGANTLLRARLRQECAKRQARVHFPELALCTDNGAMIALAAAMRLQRGIAALSTDTRSTCCRDGRCVVSRWSSPGRLSGPG